MLNIRERIEGGIYGLLVGDALGVPYEFYPALFMKAKTGKTKPNIYPPIYGGTNLISKK
jgi:ADP-ribosylglycohydrolase